MFCVSEGDPKRREHGHNQGGNDDRIIGMVFSLPFEDEPAAMECIDLDQRAVGPSR